MASDAGWLKQAEFSDGVVLSAGGRWVIRNAGALDAALMEAVPRVSKPTTLEIGRVDLLDTAGAWLLYRTIKTLKARGISARLSRVRPEHTPMLDEVSRSYKPCEIAPPQANPLVRVVEHVGAATLVVLDTAANFVAFFGKAVAALFRTAMHPRRLRFTSLVFHMEEVGVNALPIVGLISFLIGVVLAYQGATQLERFGAQIFVVDLIGITTLREIAILLTAIVIAGRSGSAFTAQIGSMKVNEEIDAMRTLGLDPIEVLVLPRLLALTITLPMLAFFADMMGLLGGGLMCWTVLGIGPELYLERLNAAVTMGSFWVGIIKAPVFALLIALVGCYEGFQVTGSAESVGRQTTRSVVEAIFLVIIADALFSILFNIVGI